jgi:hypothetical protein
MPHLGRTSRRARLLEDAPGSWGSSSQDFAHLVLLLYRHSDEYARATGGNVSPYVLAGIPMLLAGVRCLLIELAAGLFGSPPDRSRLRKLARSDNEIEYALSHYPVPGPLAKDMRLLVQLRHEILHPSHRPAGTPHNTPSYLEDLRQRNLLQSTGNVPDFIWIDQLKSHRLFQWACITVEEVVAILLTAHSVTTDTAEGLRGSYRAFRTVGADPPPSP